MNTYKLLQGGLYRCSIAFLEGELQKRAEANQPSVEGESLKCPHCEDRIILRRGVWQWDSGEVLIVSRTSDGLVTYGVKNES